MSGRVERLIAKLNDKSFIDREKAANELGNISPRSAKELKKIIKSLTKRLKNEKNRTKDTLVNSALISAIKKLMKSRHIASLGKDEITALIKELILKARSNKDRDIRDEAVLLLGAIWISGLTSKADKAVQKDLFEALVHALGDKEKSVQMASLSALIRIFSFQNHKLILALNKLKKGINSGVFSRMLNQLINKLFDLVGPGTPSKIHGTFIYSDIIELLENIADSGFLSDLSQRNVKRLLKLIAKVSRGSNERIIIISLYYIGMRYPNEKVIQNEVGKLLKKILKGRTISLDMKRLELYRIK